MSKKYYWLKLKNTYFNQLTQKKMKRQPNGREMQIIYLRMLLSSIDKEGNIYYQGVYDSLEEELAEEYDEPIEIVKQTIDFLIANNMVNIDEEFNCYLPEAVECVGSEDESAARVRRYRERKTLHCNAVVTDGNVIVTACNTEIEKRKEIDKELKKSIISSEPDKSAPIGSGILLPLVDKTFYDVPVEKITLWQQAFPGVDIHQELRKMITWCDSNPKRKKTRNGADRFINNWLERAQNSGRGYQSTPTKEETISTVSYEPYVFKFPEDYIPPELEPLPDE